MGGVARYPMAGNVASKQRPKGKPRGKPFQPGHPGNPKGRPPAGTAIKELFREALEDLDPTRKVPRIHALVTKLYTMAMSKRGNVPAARTLIEWAIPKPPQTIEHSGGVDPVADMTPEERRELIARLLEKRGGA